MTPAYTIPLSYTPIEVDALAKKLGEYSGRHHSSMITDFEERLRSITGAGHVVGLNNGSSAIHLALKAVGVGQGDYVIVSTFTYIASVSPILYFGAIPVLVDCEPHSWNMDPVLVEEAIADCIRKGKKPTAILVVHTYGMPADMDAIQALAKKNDIPILEDAAEAIGSSYQGRAPGSLGDIGVLSFNSNKILTTYGGGAVLTNNTSYADRILFWATHSRKNVPYYEHEEVGYNYRIGPVNAAVGLVQLDSLAKNVSARRAIYAEYQKQLKRVSDIRWQEELTGTTSNRWISCLAVKSGLAKIRAEFLQRKIETRPLWKPMHRQPLFRDAPSFVNGTSEYLFETGICLPSSNDLSLASVGVISELIEKAVE